MKNKILNSKVLSKIEEILGLVIDGQGVYNLLKYDSEDFLQAKPRLEPLMINGKYILSHTTQSRTTLKKHGYHKYVKFDPIKYPDHMMLLRNALTEFGKATLKFGFFDVDAVSANKELNQFIGQVVHIYDNGNDIDLFMETKNTYSNPEEARLIGYLLVLSDYEE